MAYKMKGSGFYGKGNQSPAKQFAGSDKKDILSEVENKREHHQDKFDDWIKGSKKSTDFLNKRADTLKTLKSKKYTKAKPATLPKRGQYFKDFKSIYNSDTMKSKRGQKDKINLKDLKGKSAKGIVGYLLKQGFTTTKIGEKKKSPAKQFPAMPLGASLTAGLTEENQLSGKFVKEALTNQRKKDHKKKLDKKYNKKTEVFKGKGWSENKKTDGDLKS